MIDHLVEELGDVLFKCFFMHKLVRMMVIFNIDDVIEGLSAKMVRRHPHVFGNIVRKQPKML